MVDSDRSFGNVGQKKWLRIQEACAYLGTSRRTLFRWRQEFGLPTHVVGRTTYFLKRDLDNFMERHQLHLAKKRLGQRFAQPG